MLRLFAQFQHTECLRVRPDLHEMQQIVANCAHQEASRGPIKPIIFNVSCVSRTDKVWFSVDYVWLAALHGCYQLGRRTAQQKIVFQPESSLSVLNRKSGCGVDSQDSHLEHTSGKNLPVAACHYNHSSLKCCKWSIKAESRWFFQEVNEPQRGVRKWDMHLMRGFFPAHKNCQNKLPTRCYTR